MDQAIYGLSYVENLSYLGIFLTVAFSGYALPIPEEIVLILGGYLAARGIVSLPLVMLISIFAGTTGDGLIFYLSGHGSRFTQKYHEKVEKTHLGWYLRHMKEHSWTTVFFSRFIVGMRFFNPLVAGLMNIQWKTFISATFVSTLIYTPVVVLIGYYSNHQIYRIIHLARSVRHFILIGFTILSIVLIIIFIRNLIQKKT